MKTTASKIKLTAKEEEDEADKVRREMEPMISWGAVAGGLGAMAGYLYDAKGFNPMPPDKVPWNIATGAVLGNGAGMLLYHLLRKRN